MTRMRSLAATLFGPEVARYLAHRDEERDRKPDPDALERNGKTKWIATDHDWPPQHKDDVEDHEAAELIRSDEFIQCTENVKASLENQPLRAREAEPPREPCERHG
jgi:hypothetical protein